MQTEIINMTGRAVELHTKLAFVLNSRPVSHRRKCVDMIQFVMRVFYLVGCCWLANERAVICFIYFFVKLRYLKSR